MASITDCVSEGLKYPFNDVKKILSFGVLFAIINVISFATSQIGFNAFRKIAIANGDSLALKLSQIPANDIYLIVALSVISFIITLFIMGYQYNVIKFSIDKKNELPGFGDVLNIFANGIKYFIVSLAYNIIPIVLCVVGVILINGSHGEYLIILAAILFIIFNFLLIMAMANMIDADKFTKAFDLREVLDKIANLGWGKYIGIILFTFLISAIVLISVSIILMLLSGVVAMVINQAIVISAIMTIIEGLFISPYISVFFSRVYGSIYLEANK